MAFGDPQICTRLRNDFDSAGGLRLLQRQSKGNKVPEGTGPLKRHSRLIVLHALAADMPDRVGFRFLSSLYCPNHAGVAGTFRRSWRIASSLLFVSANRLSIC